MHSRNLFVLDFVRRFFVSCAQIFKAYGVRTLMKFGCDWRKISHCYNELNKKEGGVHMKKDNYHNEDVSKEKKPLPIGISDYIRAQAEYYYVDKTLLIKEFLDQKSLVSLFTRPRRFGKTLNMDMLRVFFEKSTANTSVYFADKEIWKC